MITLGLICIPLLPLLIVVIYALITEQKRFLRAVK